MYDWGRGAGSSGGQVDIGLFLRLVTVCWLAGWLGGAWDWEDEVVWAFGGCGCDS